MDHKITVVGAGNVGAAAAQIMTYKGLAEIVLIDVVEEMPRGKALDLTESAPVMKETFDITGTNDFSATADSDLVIITAGIPRKPGMSRDDLLATNMNIMKNVTDQIVRFSPYCILIVISNPLDAMCQVAFETSGFPKNRVIGMAGVLDSARLCAFIAMELNVSIETIQAMVLGGHGDTMVPLPRYSTVSGIPIGDLIPPERLSSLIERTRNGGAEIVNLLKTGSAYYAPAASAVDMAEAILKDKRKLMPCTAYLEGEYQIDGLFMGVPLILGRNGIEKIIQLQLTDDEKQALNRSAAAVRELVEAIHRLQK